MKTKIEKHLSKTNHFVKKRAILTFFLFLGLTLLASAGPVRAQSNIEIELLKKTQPKVSIAIQGFQLQKGSDPTRSGEDSRKILENDLKLSEFFTPISHSKFQSLENQERQAQGVNFGAWAGVGAQWMIKTQYGVGRSGFYTFVFRLYDVDRKRFIVGKKYRGNRNFLRSMIHRFSDEVVAQLTGIQGVSQTKIAFISKESRKKELYMVDFDGYNLKKLTNDRSVTLSPAWSPDGKNILFTSYIDRNPDLMVIDVQKRTRKTLLQMPGLNAAPAWSPDGNRIALVLSKDENAEVYVLEKSLELKRLTRHFNIDTSPTWSPNGRKIAFTSDRSGTGSPQIYVMDSRRGDRSIDRITFNSNYNDDPSWSPDGEKLAYTARVGKKFRIKIYDFKSKKHIQFTSGSGSQEKPSWSPDGRYIAYSQRQGGREEIYIQRLGSRKSRQLTFLTGGGLSPAWSTHPKGKIVNGR